MSNLKFTRKETGRVHLDLRFVSGDHPQSDGRGKIAGSAYFPSSGGDIYFDDEENWTLETTNRLFYETNILIVAIHEVGHALGLQHSGKCSAVMAPGQYSLYRVGDVQLDVDDIQAIQALYGKPGQERPQYEAMEEFDVYRGNLRFFLSLYTYILELYHLCFRRSTTRCLEEFPTEELEELLCRIISLITILEAIL